MADESNPYGDEPASGSVDESNPYGDTPVNVEQPKSQAQSSTQETDKAFMDAITVTDPYKPPPPSGLSALFRNMITPPPGFSPTAWLQGKVTPEQKKAAEVPGGKFSVADWAAGRTTPGVPASPVKEALGGMIMEQLKPKDIQEWSFEQMFGGDIGPRLLGVQRAYEKYQAGAPVEEIKRTASPEYGMIKDITSYPVGSKEWWAAFLPLSIETAQYAAPFLGPLGRAVMGKPVFAPAGSWVGDKFVPTEFKFPEPPGVSTPPITQPGAKGFVTQPGGVPYSTTMKEAEFIPMAREYAKSVASTTDPRTVTELGLIKEAEKTGDWQKVADMHGVRLERPQPPPVPGDQQFLVVPKEGAEPAVSQEEQDAIIRRLMAQGRTEEEARAGLRAGETGRPRIYEGGREIGKEVPPPPPKPRPFEVDDIVTDEETRGRIRQADPTPDGGWKIHFDSGQVGLLYPDQPGTWRVGRIAPASSIEGISIRTGRSVEEIRATEAAKEETLRAQAEQERQGAALSRRELEQEKADASSKRRTTKMGLRGEGGEVGTKAPLRYTREAAPIQEPRPTGKAVVPEVPGKAPGAGLSQKVDQLNQLLRTGKITDPVYEHMLNRLLTEERSAGAAVEEKAAAAEGAPQPLTKPPNIGDKIVWRNRAKTVTDYNPSKGTVTFTDDETGQVHRAPFNPGRMKGVPKAKPAELPKGPLTEEETKALGVQEPVSGRPKGSDPLWHEAVANVKKHLGIPDDPAERARMQREKYLDSDADIATYTQNEYEALKAKYGGETEKPGDIHKAAFTPGQIIKSGVDRWRVTEIPDHVEPIDEHGNPLGRPIPISDAPIDTGKTEPEARAEHKEIAKEVTKEVGKEEAKEAGASLGEVPPTRDPMEPPPIPVQFRDTPPPKAVQAGAANTIEDAYKRLHASRVISEASPSEGLSKLEVIEGGRAAMRAGVDPVQVAASDSIRADLKYGVMRAHGEDLREHAIALNREAKANPSQANTARANEAFGAYNNWDIEVQKQKMVANAEFAKRGVEGIEEERDIQNMVDARRQFVETFGRDWHPEEKARIQKAVDDVEYATKARTAADQDYSRQLEQAAPHPEYEIKNKDELNNAVANIMKRIFPCPPS